MKILNADIKLPSYKGALALLIIMVITWLILSYFTSKGIISHRNALVFFVASSSGSALSAFGLSPMKSPILFICAGTVSYFVFSALFPLV